MISTIYGAPEAEAVMKSQNNDVVATAASASASFGDASFSTVIASDCRAASITLSVATLIDHPRDRITKRYYVARRVVARAIDALDSLFRF